MKFTDLSVKALPMSTRQRVFFDDSLPGFGVRVSPRSKTFVVLVRRNNATRWATLGKYPDLSLSAARKNARAHLHGNVAISRPLSFEEAFGEYQQRHLSRVRP